MFLAFVSAGTFVCDFVDLRCVGHAGLLSDGYSTWSRELPSTNQDNLETSHDLIHTFIRQKHRRIAN
jgi:hypothetical protein